MNRKPERGFQQQAVNIKYYPLLMFLLVLNACASNEMKFDIPNQRLISANSKGIRYVQIQRDSIPESFIISWTDDNRNVPVFIDFNNIEIGYYVGKWTERIDNKSFRLSPNSRYSIERAQGDAGPFSIKVRTGDDGKVVEVLEK